jgi:hypothetical protein
VQRWRQSRTARRLAIIAILLLDLAVLGTDVFLLHGRNETTVVDLDDALAQFREGPAAAVASGTPAETVPGAAAAETTVAPAVTTAPGGTQAPVSSTPSPTTTAAPAQGLTLPSPGVYAYATEGGESISLLGSSHSYPGVTYGVVRHLGGCAWEITSEVVKEHRDRRELCNEPARILQPSQQRSVEFLGTREGMPYVCSPALVLHEVGQAPGSRATATCNDGDGTTAELEAVFLGTGQETVGGQVVDVIKIRLDATFSGAARGTSTDDYTLVASTGLPVRVVRTLDSITNALGNDVRYRESATFVLQSLTPAT